MAEMPPPPIPWIHRPTNNWPTFFETPATTAPTKKKMIAMMKTGRRPKMLEKETKFGWKTGRHKMN